MIEATLIDERFPHVVRLGTLHVLEAVVDLSASSAILTSVQFNLSLDRLPGGHLHVSVTGSGRISDLIVPLEVTKRHGVTATDLSSNSLWVLTLRPKPTTHGRQATIHARPLHPVLSSLSVSCAATRRTCTPRPSTNVISH